MKCGTAFTPDGPLTLGDIFDIADHYQTGGGNRELLRRQLVEVRTPINDRQRVTLTVTDQLAPIHDVGPSDVETEGTEHNG